MKSTRNLCLGLAAGLAMTATPGLLKAQQIYSSWLTPSYIMAVETSIKWAERVKEATNGDLDFEVFFGGSLIPAKSTMQGVADGLAQVGLHTATYTPSDLPIATALADIGFETPDAMVMSFAYGDFMMNDPDGYGDWRNNGVIFGGSYSTPVYYFICREALSSLEDFKGKRIRMPGGGWARFGQAIDAVGVNVPSSEIYEAFDRGSVDCTASDPTHLNSGSKLMEVVGSITTLKMSPFYAGTTHAYNVDFWQGLTDEQRRILLDETSLGSVRMQISYAAAAKDAFAAAKTHGVAVIEPDASLQGAYDTWIKDGVGGMADIAQQTHGIENPEELYARFRTYVTKWEDLLATVDRTNEEEMNALLKANLYDKIDVSTYGMD